MGWHSIDFKNEYKRKDDQIPKEKEYRHFGLDICLILIAGAFFYAVFHMDDSFEDIAKLLRSHFPEGLVVGTFIGLTRYAKRHDPEDIADQLQEEQELAEQKKEEEYGYHNYRSSGM